MASTSFTFTAEELDTHNRGLLANSERLIKMQKRSIETQERKIYEMQHNSRDLAQSLGFKDVMDAQQGIADAGGLSYREVIALHRKNISALVEVEKLREELEHERAVSKEALSQLEILRRRYDDLLIVKERAAELYKVDFARWKKFKGWLYDEELLEKDKKKQTKMLSAEDRRAYDKSKLLKKRQMLQDIGPDFERLEAEFGVVIPNTSSSADKENLLTPVKPEQWVSSTPPVNPSAYPIANRVSPTPLKSSTNVRSQKPSTGAPSAAVILVPNSSDTEHSPQASPSKPHAINHDVDMSDTDENTQDSLPAPSAQPPRAPVTPFQQSNRRASSGAETEYSRPLKYRRVSEEIAPLSASIPSSSKRTMIQDMTPVQRRRVAKPLPKETPVASSSKGKSKEMPVASSTKKKLDDYSKYKGHGRYAQSGVSAEKNINAEFEIDPEQNAGLDYQYDEVVRTKEARKKMHGGDCECCRDYYEQVGPMPPRLQPPLWKSPTSSPTSTPCRAGETVASSKKRDAVDAHKKDISRHRHHWARTNTPPGYWNIAFPDTQETDRINKEAAKMHERKREEIEREARKGDGRYKKKR
ncbi:DNA repair protein endonuclease SAE2/CtIP C-terminus-domain-containing protein [Mycena floridula]|nr:DNA repair protein endonuclease SAE2/CtIP C-terminus-domain-containing protein [Mycena floridula]